MNMRKLSKTSYPSGWLVVGALGDNGHGKPGDKKVVLNQLAKLSSHQPHASKN